MSHAIITPEEMYAAEKRVFDAGTPSFDVMTLAGESVADHLDTAFPDGKVRVLCGPGGNGGDGFIAASRLRELGREVSVYLLGDPAKLEGDNARAFRRWSGPVGALEDAIGVGADITLDALFGGGLSRPLSGTAAELSQEVCRTVSIDVPSGLDGLSAKPIGPAFTADLTVTFAALRPAHVLSPGRQRCGRAIVQDIGVPVGQAVQLNHDALWRDGMRDPVHLSGALASRLEIHDKQSFTRSFPALQKLSRNRLEAVIQAARKQDAPVMLCASEILAAFPDGRCIIEPEVRHVEDQQDVVRKYQRQAMEAGLPLFESVSKALSQMARRR